MNTDSITLHDPVDTDDYVHVYPRRPGPTPALRDVVAYVEVMEDSSQACVRFTRRQAHELHAYLGELLGLGIPTPKAPLTASAPHRGGTKASRNLDRPAHGGYPSPRSWDAV